MQSQIAKIDDASLFYFLSSKYLNTSFNITHPVSSCDFYPIEFITNISVTINTKSIAI